MKNPASSETEDEARQPVLLFDGECGLCNRLVRFLLRLDSKRRLCFAPLQSEPAQNYLRRHGLPTKDFESLVFVPDWNFPDRADYRMRTSGVIAALRECGGGARVVAALVATVPASWRDSAYRAVGRWRYRIFGPWKPRPLPRPEWAARFLA